MTGNYTNPMREPVVRRYTVNRKPLNMNTFVERQTKCVNNTHDLSNYEIVGYIRGDQLVRKPDLLWIHFDYVTYFNESKNVRADRHRLTFISQKKGKDPVILVVKLKD